MLGKKDKTDLCYLVVWFDLAERKVRHEVLAHDCETMHGFANQRRAEIELAIKQIAGEDPPSDDPWPELAHLITVFEVKDPKQLEGALELVFRNGD